MRSILLLLALVAATFAAPLTGNKITEDGTYTVTTIPGARYVFAVSGDFGGGSLAINWNDGTNSTAYANSPATAAETWTFTAASKTLELVLSDSTDPDLTVTATQSDGNVVDNSAVNEALAEDPTASRNAIRSKRIFNVLDYNASGNGETSTTGSITSGQPTLTVASSLTFSAGHGIRIEGAGTAGGPLVTTIAAVNGATITLSTNAATTVASAAVKHDDTAAINAAIAACVNGGGGTVYLPAGWYRCAPSSLDASTNSVLTFPMLAGHGVQLTPVKILGDGRGKLSFTFEEIDYDGGATIIDTTDITTPSGTTPAVVSFAPWTANPSWSGIAGNSWNKIIAHFDGLSIFTAHGSLTGINAWNCHGLHLGNDMTIIAICPNPPDPPDSNWPAYPVLPYTTNYGVIFPADLNTGMMTSGTTWIGGFGTGIRASEHIKFERTAVAFCEVGLLVWENDYFTHLIQGSLDLEFNRTVIRSLNSQAVLDLTVEYEFRAADGGSGDDWTVLWGFQGVGGERGIIRYSGLNSSGGNIHPGAFPVTGGGRMVFHDLKNDARTHGWFSGGTNDTSNNPPSGNRLKLSMGSASGSVAGQKANIKFAFVEDWISTQQWVGGVGSGPNGIEFINSWATGAASWDFWSNGNHRFTLGNEGSLQLRTVGKTLHYKAGTNGTIGTGVQLSSGVATVTTTSVFSSSQIFIAKTAHGGTSGVSYLITKNVGTGFTITSVDASGATVTTDTSTFDWFIVDRD